MTLEDLQARRTRMIDYLKLKVDEADWHGTADAAMDLREIEAQVKVLSTIALDKIAPALPATLRHKHVWQYRVSLGDYECIECGATVGALSETHA